MLAQNVFALGLCIFKVDFKIRFRNFAGYLRYCAATKHKMRRKLCRWIAASCRVTENLAIYHAVLPPFGGCELSQASCAQQNRAFTRDAGC